MTTLSTMLTTTNEPDEPLAKRSKNDDTGVGMTEDADEDGGTVDDLQAKIVAAWNDNEPEVALATTVAILSTQIDKLIKDGITAFHQAESSQNEVAQLREDIQRKDTEIASLRAAEEKNTAALSVRASCTTTVVVPPILIPAYYY